MSTLILKIVATVSMVVDHIGYAIGSDGFAAMGFSDGYYLFRAFGRISLPLFAFLIANGFRHTRSVKKYALRLLAFAIISEVPYDLFVSDKITIAKLNGIIPDICFDNVFFTLLLGLAFLCLNDIYKKKQIKFRFALSAVTFVFLALFSGFISADYGFIGVAWVAMFGVIDIEKKENLPKLFIGSTVLAYWRLIARSVLVVTFRLTKFNLLKIPGSGYIFSGYHPIMALIQTVSLVSFGFILLYNGKKGTTNSPTLDKIIKYGFYAFYPIHLLVLWYLV